jgi:hypothetical protein
MSDSSRRTYQTASELADAYQRLTAQQWLARFSTFQPVIGDDNVASFSFNIANRHYKLTIEDITPDAKHL